VAAGDEPALATQLRLAVLVHEEPPEGAPASWMRRIAARAGFERRFETWVERLERDAVSPAGRETS